MPCMCGLRIPKFRLSTEHFHLFMVAVLQILPNATDGYTITTITGGTSNSNVIGPWLQGYAVIAACVGEIGDLDMVYVHGICVCNQ